MQAEPVLLIDGLARGVHRVRSSRQRGAVNGLLPVNGVGTPSTGVAVNGVGQGRQRGKASWGGINGVEPVNGVGGP